MNETQVNNFLHCLLQIDDLNYLALHTRAAVMSSRNGSTAPQQHATADMHRDSVEHEHNHNYGDDVNVASTNHKLLIAKVTAMVVLFCASTFFGSIPFLLNRYFRWTENHANARSAIIVKCLLYFGGGVLLATTFLHLLPEVQHIVEQLQECDILPVLSFSLADLLMCAGFFSMYLIEELLHSYIHRHMRSMARTADAGAAFERGHGVRNSYLVRGSSKNAKMDGGSDLAQLQNNNELNIVTVTEHTRNATLPETDGVAHSPGRPGTLSMQNLIANDVEHQKYGQHQCSHEPELQQCHEYKSHEFQLEKNEQSKYESSHHPHQQHYHHHHHHHHQHHGHGKQHVHSHLPVDVGADSDDTITSSLRGLFIVLALSLHELFEGMAIGLERNAADVWFMFGAVSAHKLVLAFCVGVELIVARTRFTLCSLYILTFAVVSPIGIGIGILISYREDVTAPTMSSAILQGLACGTLLYVVFFEILSKSHTGLLPYFSLLIGFLVMFGLQQLGAEGHGHSHGNCSGMHAHSHDHDAVHADGTRLLLRGLQNAYAAPTSAHSLKNHLSHLCHEHESSHSNEVTKATDSESFERELDILRQASKKLIQNNMKVD